LPTMLRRRAAKRGGKQIFKIRKFTTTIGRSWTTSNAKRNRPAVLLFLSASVTSFVFASTSARCEELTVYGTPLSEVEEYVEEVWDPYVKYEQSEDSTRVLASPRTVLIIEWTINSNVVVYQARMKDGELVDEDPLKAFWLEVDQHYVAKARRKGKQTDRRKLTNWEKRFTFGAETRRKSEGLHSVKILWAKKLALTLKLNDLGYPVLLGNINGERCIVKKLYVVCKNKASFQRIEIFGVTVDEGEDRREVIFI